MSEKEPDNSYLPFSQRNGYEKVPPQLQIGEISPDFRRFVEYAIDTEMLRESGEGYGGRYFHGAWERVTKDFWVRVLKQPVKKYPFEYSDWEVKWQQLVSNAKLPLLFNAIEFLARHPQCSRNLKAELKLAFIEARAAYRLFDDGQIRAIGTDQQAEAFLDAIDATAAAQALGARQHLLNAGAALRQADWSSSIRESIHAVESVAVLLAPEEGTLGAALKAIEKNGKIHGALKTAFNQLYGYTSDEEGVRHALVFQDKSAVDEVDALFMLGACASFVSYLLSRAPDHAQ